MSAFLPRPGFGRLGLGRLGRDKGGNVAITTALTLPLVIASLALGIDYGHLTLQQRQLQSTADLAAIASAGNLAEPEKAALAFFTLNHQDIAVRTDKGLLTSLGEVPFSEVTALADHEAYAKLTKGRYTPDPDRPTETRFEPGVAPYDAVRVTMFQKGTFFFANSFAEVPTLSATGTAAADKLAAFSIGSRLASLNEGVINALLGQLLGTTVSLKVMDYQALADTQINALKTIDALAIDLGLQAGTYSDVLKTNIGYGKLLNAIGKTTGLTPAVTTLLKTLETSVNKTKTSLKLENALALGPLAERPVGQSDGLAVNVSLLDLISAGAVAANGEKQIGVDLGSTIPGLGSVKLSVAIGEPPVETPQMAVGTPGSIIRTAQTRISVEVLLDGLQAVAGLKVRLPLYIEIAHAEARLDAITCNGVGKNAATVDIQTAPGIVEISLGDVDKTAFANFGKDPRVTRTDLITSSLLDVTALAYTNATNMNLKKLSFSPAEITAGKIKSISTKDTLTTLVDSLLTNLELKVELLNLPIILPKAITSAVNDTLKLVTAPLDTVLYNTLLTLGIRIGEVDVRVTGAQCRNPVLVQ